MRCCAELERIGLAGQPERPGGSLTPPAPDRPDRPQVPTAWQRPGRRTTPKGSLGRLMAALWVLLALLFAIPAAAHKSSDAYLQLDATPGRLALRWDIALRDLDIALDLDTDGDGRLSWGEVKAGWPRILAYASARLAITGCPLREAGVAPALERRNDGSYAVLRFVADCTLPDPPALRYTLLGELDPTHRGLAKIARPGRPIVLTVLDPSASASASVNGSGVPSAGAAGALNASAASGATTASGTAASAAAEGPNATSASAALHPAAAAATAAAPSRWQFLSEGVRHILTGYDHVLFLICLLLPAVLRRTPAGWRPVERLGEAFWPVIGIVSAFTVAHSLTLGLAALKLVSLPSAVIEPAIAVTIMLAAVDNLRPVFPVPRIVVAFVFGLVHGFGFAGVLSELDLPAADFAWALLQFNLGLECGQLLIVLIVTLLLFALRRARRYRPVVLSGGSVLAFAIAAAWFVERVANIRILPF